MKQGAEYLSSNTKRSLDLLGGFVVGSALIPVAAGLGVGASIDTRMMNPFFRQERVGKDEEEFMVLKFRTIAKAAMSGASYGTFDHRASKWGQMFRQTGLDELPQIYNVVRGSMSLVGARPMVEQDIEFMEHSAPNIFEEWHAYYQSARPGLTGPSQIYRHHFLEGKSKEIYRKSAELDLAYFDSASLATDLKILAHTPIDMLRSNIGVIDRQNTVELSEIPEASPSSLAI